MPDKKFVFIYFYCITRAWYKPTEKFFFIVICLLATKKWINKIWIFIIIVFFVAL